MTDSLKDRSESLTKKVLELATLYEMSRALGSTLDMDDLLGSVLDSALRIFDLDVGYIALRDKDTGQLVVRAVRGSDTVPSDVVRSSMSEWVVREGRPLIFNPDTYPINLAFWKGTLTEEEMQEEHPLELAQILDRERSQDEADAGLTRQPAGGRQFTRIER